CGSARGRRIRRDRHRKAEAAGAAAEAVRTRGCRRCDAGSGDVAGKCESGEEEKTAEGESGLRVDHAFPVPYPNTIRHMLLRFADSAPERRGQSTPRATTQPRYS